MTQVRCKLRNKNRLRKRDSAKQERSYVMTPPKSQYKNTFYHVYGKFQEKNGYDYECNESRTMKWMKEQFQNKMCKYLGNKLYVGKQTRMDKVRLKQELNFKYQKNPLITIFTKIDRNIQMRMVQSGFRALYQSIH